MSGLCFPIHPFIIELLTHFRIASRQLMPNSWRIVVSCMEIWLAATVEDMIKVDELVHLYRLKESKEYGYYKPVPWVQETRIVRDLPLSFWYWKSQFFFVSGDDFETLSGKVWGDVPRLLCRWGTPSLGALSFRQSFVNIIFWLIFCHLLTFLLVILCTVNRWPKLKTRYK